MDGIIYILKFDPPFHHARYYVGWCKPRGLMNRIKQHRQGHGAHITRAAVQQGHRLVLVADFPGTRDGERAIKNRKNTPKFVQQLERHGLLNIQEPRTRKCDKPNPLPSPAGLNYYDLDEGEDNMGIDLSHIDLVALIEKDLSSKLKKESKCHTGSCPFCGEGNNRFVVWAHKWWCRRCEKSGDAINYLRLRHNLTFAQACNELGVNLPGRQPNPRTVNRPVSSDNQPANNITLAPERESAAQSDPGWAAAATTFAKECHVRLMLENSPARQYLNGRGLTDETLMHLQIGYNHRDRHDKWGATKVFLPAGIVFPWYDEKEAIQRVNFRCDEGPDKYRLAAGSAQTFYLGDRITPGCQIIMVEGEIDALTILQAYDYDPLVCPIATGSTTHGRTVRLIMRLGQARSILIAFDNDDGGRSASAFWTSLSKKATTLFPPSPHKDVNALYLAALADPENDGKVSLARAAVRAWIEGEAL